MAGDRWGARHLFRADPSGEVRAMADDFEQPTGLEFSPDGTRLYVSGWDGVRCNDPDGTLIGRIPTSECASHCVFGGRKRTRLFITAATSVYSITFGVSGVPRAYDRH